MEDRSKQTGVVRPPLDERCGEQRECDSVLSATYEELNGETDDEEDGETAFDDGSAQVRNIRGQPTVKENQEHLTTHRPYRSWCKFCVMGRGVNAPHQRSDAQDDLEGVPRVSMYCGVLGEKKSEDRVSLVLVIRERRDKMTWAMLVPRKATERGSSTSSGTTESRSDATMSRRLKRWQGKSDKPVKKGAKPFQRDRQLEKASPTGSSNVQWGSLPARPEH